MPSAAVDTSRNAASFPGWPGRMAAGGVFRTTRTSGGVSCRSRITASTSPGVISAANGPARQNSPPADNRTHVKTSGWAWEDLNLRPLPYQGRLDIGWMRPDVAVWRVDLHVLSLI